MNKKGKAIRMARSYSAFKAKEEARKKTFITIAAVLALFIILYVLNGYLHLWFKDVEIFSKETQMILYLSFFVVLLVLTLAKSSGKKKRAQKFLQEQINILESVLQNFDSDPKGYEELADKIIKITDDTSEENKNKLREFLLGHTLSDCFVDKSVTTSKLERDLSLFQVISPQVEMLWKDKSILSPYRSFLKMELISRLEYEGRELMIRFKHAARNRLENLKELA